MEPRILKQIVEAALLTAQRTLSVDELLQLFEPEEQVNSAQIKQTLQLLQQDCALRGVELVQLASGWRYQAKPSLAEWLDRLWLERPPRYSRALLETLALIAYRQPVTRAEIEDIRGVSVSSAIMKTLQERDWIRAVGYRELPGRPALWGTTRQFLDDFNLTSLAQLPSLLSFEPQQAVANVNGKAHV